MRILVLGATGMLGHKVVQVFRDRYEIWATIRDRAEVCVQLGLIKEDRLLRGVEATNMDSVVKAFVHCHPQVVINCLGIIKQLEQSKAHLPSITVNALFPHRLADLCRAAGARFIHISTDCVFSGRKGNYSEDDIPDAEDLYGRSKLLGEVTSPGCLTLRTSIIGRSLHQDGPGLMDWFIGQRGKKVKGFARAIYSGITTTELSNVIANLLERHPTLEGLWHVSSKPISKYNLLGLINEAMELEITIEKDETFVCDRSLNSTRFRNATGYEAPDWVSMIASAATDYKL
jgi:dTDP-4-dehydrorhamnose reductase